jgi:hypothetical protein
MVRIDALAIEDIHIYRHWHAGSEKYASGASLATAIYLGWTMNEIVYREEHWRAGRCSSVYHVTLGRGSEIMKMPVIANPYVTRLLNESPVQVVLIAERHAVLRPVRAS